MSDLTPRQWHSVAKKMRSHRSYRGEMDQIRKEAKLRRKEREKRGKKEEKTRNRRNRWHEKRRKQLNLTQLTQMTGTRWGHKEGGEDCVLALVKLIQLVRTQIPNLHWCHNLTLSQVNTWSLSLVDDEIKPTFSAFGHVSVCFYLSPNVINQGI